MVLHTPPDVRPRSEHRRHQVGDDEDGGSLSWQSGCYENRDADMVDEGIIHLRDRTLSPAAKAFIETVREADAEVEVE